MAEKILDSIKEQIDKSISLIDDIIGGNGFQEEKIKSLVSMQTIIRGINQILLRFKDERNLFITICDLLVTHKDIKLAMFGIVNEKKDEIKEIYLKGDENLIKKVNFTIDSKIFLPIKTDEIFVDNNYNDKDFNNEIKSFISIPIFNDSNSIGILSIFSKKENFFLDEEISFLKELSQDISIRIMSIRQEREVESSFETVKNALFNLILSISKTVELKDPLAKNHGHNVGKLALKIAEKLNLDKEKLDFIYLASLVHDVGKLTVASEILNKPSKLTEIEYEIVKIHPEAGYNFLKDIKLPLPIADVVLEHHEREDGSGYPKGLKGDEIMLEAKIIGISEVVHAMTSFKPYRPAYTIEETLEYLKNERGKKFNERLVDIIIEIFKEGFSFD